MKMIGCILAAGGLLWLLFSETMFHAAAGEAARKMTATLEHKDCFTRKEVAATLEEYKTRVWKAHPKTPYTCFVIIIGFALYGSALSRRAQLAHPPQLASEKAKSAE